MKKGHKTLATGVGVVLLELAGHQTQGFGNQTHTQSTSLSTFQLNSVRTNKSEGC